MGERVDPSGINGVSGLQRFREEWDHARRIEGASFENARSQQGHINVEGSARCLSSLIFTPAAPQFWSALEPGIRPLVIFLIEALECITYSSCEGHPPTDDGYPMRGRHVGILPRDAAENARLLGVLRNAAEATAPVGGIVHVEIKEDVLASDGVDLPCVDVLFIAGSFDWPAYAANVDGVQNAFIERLEVLTKPSGASPA
jgi:hypothetical protein